MKSPLEALLSRGSELLFNAGVTLVEKVREKGPVSPPHCAILLPGVVAVTVGVTAETEKRSTVENHEAVERLKGTLQDSHGKDSL